MLPLESTIVPEKTSPHMAISRQKNKVMALGRRGGKKEYNVNKTRFVRKGLRKNITIY